MPGQEKETLPRVLHRVNERRVARRVTERKRVAGMGIKSTVAGSRVLDPELICPVPDSGILILQYFKTRENK